MRGMDYLVGVRFEASGNLYQAMGRLSASMLAADEGVKLLKNRFVDMAAEGVSMFAALTGASVQYTNSVAQLAVTLNGVKNLHKNLGFVYGAPGASAYLSPGTRADIVSNAAPLFYGKHPKGANRGFANLVNTAQFGLQMSGKGATSMVSSLMSAGVFYAEDMGHRRASTQDRIAMGVTRQVMGHLDMVLPSQRGTYLSTAEQVFSSPLISKLGAHMTPAMLAPVIGALVRANVPGGAQGVINLLAGKGMTNTGALEALMTQQFHFGIGTRNNVLAAATGNFLYLKDHGVANPYTYMAHMGLQGLERMAGFKSYISPNKMTPLERQKFISEADLVFGNRNAAMRDLVIAKLRDPTGFMHTKSNYAVIQAAGKQRTQRSIDYLMSSLDTFTGLLGKFVETAPIIHSFGHAIYGADRWYGHHHGTLKSFGAAGVSGSLSSIGAGVSGAVSFILGKLGSGGIITLVTRGVTGILYRAFSGIAAFQGGYALGSLMRAIPWVRDVGNFIGGVVYRIGRMSPSLQHLFRAIADFLKMLGGQGGTLSYISRIAHNMGEVIRPITRVLGPINNALKDFSGANILWHLFVPKHHGMAATTALGGLLHATKGRTPYTIAWSADEGSFNKKKDMEQWDVAYTNPITNRAAVSTVHIHLHGANPNSKGGLEDIRKAVMSGLQRATNAAGFHTATTLAEGNGG